MKTVPLGQVCDIAMGQAPAGSSYNDLGRGLPLVAGAGDFSGGQLKPSKSTTQPTKVSARGDIVLSIRASIGAKAWADGEYCLGRGVAGLRSRPGLEPHFLWHWLTATESALAAKGRGATFLQVNRRDIAEMPMDLPELDEQRRIAAILDQADALRAKRRQVLAHFDSLTESVFHDMFGDPMTNAEGRPLQALRDWIEPDRPITYGILKPGPDVLGGVPYVRVADLQKGAIALAGIRRTTPEIARAYRRSELRPGDLLMSIRGHVGRFAFVPEALAGANITQDSARLAVHDPDSAVYLRAAMESQTVQGWMARRTKGAAVQGINLGDLRELPIPVPHPAETRRLAGIVRAAELQRERAQRALAADDELFASVQSRAFRGEL